MKTRHILFGAVYMMGMVGGCAMIQPEDIALQINRGEAKSDYIACFDKACFTQSIDGQIDLVLTSSRFADGNPDRCIAQMVHMRVLWQPTHNVRLDSPSATNSVVDWYVKGSANDQLRYTGSAWARVNIDNDIATVTISNAQVSLASASGQLSDPIHAGGLTGKFNANRDAVSVKSALDDIAALQSTPQTALIGTPIHSPTTP